MKIFKNFRIFDCYVRIQNQLDECIKMSTNKSGFGPAVLEIAWCVFIKQRCRLSVDTCSQREETLNSSSQIDMCQCIQCQDRVAKSADELLRLGNRVKQIRKNCFRFDWKCMNNCVGKVSVIKRYIRISFLFLF